MKRRQKGVSIVCKIALGDTFHLGLRSVSPAIVFENIQVIKFLNRRIRSE